MSDRCDFLTVALEKDLPGDVAAAIKAAIEQIRGVAAVESHIQDGTAWAAYVTARQELSSKCSKLWDVLYPRKGI